MTHLAKYVWTAIIVAVLVHVVALFAFPNVIMNVALKRVSNGGHYNVWRLSDRVTAESRAVVRPSPDFAYSVCPYDLSKGPVHMHVEPWQDYWSLSLYAANSDNFFTLNDRETQGDSDVTLVRSRNDAPDGVSRVVVSPSGKGIALIRRLAPTPEDYVAAAHVARQDVCERVVTQN